MFPRRPSFVSRYTGRAPQDVDVPMLRKTFALITLTLGLIALPAAIEAAPQPLPEAGAISGCVTQPDGTVLPDVSVLIGWNGRRLVTLATDAAGCYKVHLPAGLYFVFVTAPGFTSITRDQVALELGHSQVLDFQMRIPPICECITVKGWDTLAGLWKSADAVVRVRITGHDPDAPETRFTANVLQSWKRNRSVPISKTITFGRRVVPGEKEPYVVGQEFVLFLDWYQWGLGLISNDEGPVLAFAVEDGDVVSGPLAQYVGANAPVGALLKDIEALSRRQ